jgi:hypothetical protein
MARTVFGNHPRFIQTYFTTYPGYFFAGDGAHRYIIFTHWCPQEFLQRGEDPVALYLKSRNTLFLYCHGTINKVSHLKIFFRDKIKLSSKFYLRVTALSGSLET